MRVLSRTWQMLFKGLAEVKEAAKPLAAAEMVLVRIAYAADLPSPEEVIRTLDARNSSGTEPKFPVASAPPSAGSAMTTALARDSAPAAARATAVAVSGPTARAAEPARQTEAPVRTVASFQELIALAAERRDLMVKTALERDVRLVHFEEGRLEIALEPGAAKTLAGDLARKISAWTGRRWMVVVSTEGGAPTVRAQQEAREAELKRGVAADPLVQAVLQRFPGAEIVAVRQTGEDNVEMADEAPLEVPPEPDEEL
jgi:DNA polymerase-3 subunit gamma/tau